MPDENDLRRMSKRRFLKIASAMGVSATSLRYGTQEALAKAKDGDSVPYVKALITQYDKNGTPTGQDPRYGSIPRDIWEVKWTADDAAQRIQHQIRNQFPGDAHLITAGWGAMESSPTGYGVHVSYQEIECADGRYLSPDATIETVREELPDKQRGIVGEDDHRTERTVPVVVEQQRSREVADCLSDTNWESVPGGTAMSSNNGGGTYCAAFHHRDYGIEGMITSGHVCGSDGAYVYDASGELHGTARDVYNGSDIDYAWVELSSGDSPLREISDTNGGTDWIVSGIATDSELKYDTDTNTTYYGQGDANCRQTGNIQRFKDTWVEYGPHTAGGDSGGTLWKKGPGGEALIAGVCVEDLRLAGSKWTTAETVQNHANGYFTTK